MVQNYHVETGKGEASICVEFKHLRRSSRTTKRNYGEMQGPNTGTGRRAKKPKLPDDECLTDTLPTDRPFKEPASDSFTSDSPIEPHGEPPNDHQSEPPTNTSATSTPATNEPTIDKSSVGCPDIVEALDPSGTVDLPTSAICDQIEGDETVNGMSPTTHRAGYDILNDFFGQPAIGLEAVSDVERPGKWPAFTTESTHRDEVLENTVVSNTPEALDAARHTPSTGINAASSEASDILDPDLAIASAATSESGSSGSSEPGSLSTDQTSYTPSETHVCSDLPSGAQHTAAYVKRSILDDPAPWLEHVLTALETGDTSRRLNSVPGVLDDILTKGDFTLCVRIMTSIAENWVKCNRCIAKPAFDAA
jgi:hypothetical protein